MRERPPHRTAALLSVGDELTLGQTLDTNTKWLADRLWSAGVTTVEHATVDDDESRIARALDRLGTEADLLIVTGGLGPTADDLTRFALARVIGGGADADRVTIEEDPGALATLRAWFADRPGGMPEANRVQATRPDGAELLANANGTAPGLFARVERLGCDVWCLPGPPREMHPMFDDHVAPKIRREDGVVGGVRLLLTIGIGESAIAERLGDLLDRGRPARGLPLVGTTASGGVVTCRVRHEAADSETLVTALDAVEADIGERLRPAVFARRDPAKGDSLDIGGALAGALIRMLTERGEMIAFAESCTCGLLGATLTAVPGSSASVFGGFQTYANEAKAALLDIDMSRIDRFGAVSAEVASSMAKAMLSRAREADSRVAHAVSITGVAGPGASEAKPAGTVFIGLASRDADVEVRRFAFRGGREAVRSRSTVAAMAMLRLRLIDESMPLLGEVSGET